MPAPESKVVSIIVTQDIISLKGAVFRKALLHSDGRVTAYDTRGEFGFMPGSYEVVDPSGPSILPKLNGVIEFNRVKLEFTEATASQLKSEIDRLMVLFMDESCHERATGIPFRRHGIQVNGRGVEPDIFKSEL